VANQPTTERLALALTHAKAPQVLVDRARAGYYDDFKSDLPLPIVALVNDAKQYHLNNIALRAMNGEFDSQKWEAEAWVKSEEGQSVMREIAQRGTQG
jgi:hypothetical protein